MLLEIPGKVITEDGIVNCTLAVSKMLTWSLKIRPVNTVQMGIKWIYLVSESYVTSKVRLAMSLPNALQGAPAKLSCADNPALVSLKACRVYPRVFNVKNTLVESVEVQTHQDKKKH